MGCAKRTSGSRGLDTEVDSNFVLATRSISVSKLMRNEVVHGTMLARDIRTYQIDNTTDLRRCCLDMFLCSTQLDSVRDVYEEMV